MTEKIRYPGVVDRAKKAWNEMPLHVIRNSSFETIVDIFDEDEKRQIILDSELRKKAEAATDRAWERSRGI